MQTSPCRKHLLYTQKEKKSFLLSAPLLVPLCEDFALMRTPCSTEEQSGLSG